VTDATEGEGNSTWTRLTRRKVVQWGIAYAAGAWGFLQGLAYVSSLLNWPAQLQRLTGLALLVGLPIVLVLAWYHGDRGEQHVGRTELAILTGLFLLGGGLFWRYQHASSAVPVAATPPPTTAATDHSIAVLPFVNMSPDKDQEYFADGISEELLNLLAQVPELRVIARTSSFSFKGKEVDVATIAKTLNVANVLEGSVRKSGDKVRITAQLIRASDSSHLWSQTYDRQMTDVFHIQDEIAAAVVQQLRIKLLGETPRAKPVDPRAYALYLQARQLSRQRTPEGFRKSTALLQEALAIEPEYVMAWDGLATVYLNEGNTQLRPMEEAIRLGRDAINRELAIDPDFAAGYARLGYISMVYDADLAGAARHLLHAIALAPPDPAVVSAAALLANALGRADEAIALNEYVIASDPANPVAQQNGGFIYLCAGRFDQSLERFRTAAQLAPGGIGNHFAIGMILLHKGETAAALAELQKESSERMRLIGVSTLYHALGRDAESDAMLAEAIQKFGTDTSVQLALAFALRKDADRTFEWLEKAVTAHDSRLFRVAVEPWLAGVHSDRRWLPFLRKIGMAPEQLAAIRFDVQVPQ